MVLPVVEITCACTTQFVDSVRHARLTRSCALFVSAPPPSRLPCSLRRQGLREGRRTVAVPARRPGPWRQEGRRPRPDGRVPGRLPRGAGPGAAGGVAGERGKADVVAKASRYLLYISYNTSSVRGWIGRWPDGWGLGGAGRRSEEDVAGTLLVVIVVVVSRPLTRSPGHRRHCPLPSSSPQGQARVSRRRALRPGPVA